MLFDFDALPARERYKLLVSTVVPRPIAWVVSQDEAGRLNAAPFSFFNAVCDEPPLVVIGVGAREGAAKDTANNIRATGQFVVNLVSEPMAQAMNVTAIEFAPHVNELQEASLATLPSVHVAPPRIAESPVALECRQFALIDLSPGRTLVLGQVLAMHVHDEAVLDAAKHYIDTPRLGLVGRMHGRGWYARTSDRMEIARIAAADWKRAE